MVGGGIIGLAVARELSRSIDAVDVVVFEKESTVGLHQTGRNSGVVHAGLYYAPGSLKARLCRRGSFCYGITWRNTISGFRSVASSWWH